MKFISKYKSYSLVVKSERYVLDSMGNRAFVPGLEAKFQDFEFSTEDPELIEGMKKNPSYGVDFWGEEKMEQTEESKKLAASEKKASEDLLNACPLCSKKFDTVKGLESHMKMMHK